MTDQDKNSNAPSAGGSSVVMMDKKSSSRRKPFPVDLQDETPVELHHKRSRAPAVPSVTEELKESTGNVEMTSEMPKLASKVSSKRASSPESIAMVPIEVDVQRVDVAPSATQPIPVPVGPETSDVTAIKDIEHEDSITDEITELRIEEVPHREWDIENRIQKCVPGNSETITNSDTELLQRKIASEIISKIDNETENKRDIPTVQQNEGKIHFNRNSASGTVAEGITSTEQFTKKEISWNQSTYLDKVQLQNSRSVAWVLDRKASVGPCFRKTLPYGEPSGITICLPKKSQKNLNDNIKSTKSGGIIITVSKRYLGNNTKFPSDFEMMNKSDRVVLPRKENKIEIHIKEDNCVNFFENLKGRLDNWRSRIKHVLHM